MEELFKEHSKLPKWVQLCLWKIKQFLGIISIYENGLCVLPYKKIEKGYQIKIICKILTKLQYQVVLSRYLQTTILKEEIEKNKILLLDGIYLFEYVCLNVLEYIAKMKKEELNKQEVTILVNKLDRKKERQIIQIAQHVKRVQIVTRQIQIMHKLEEQLEMQGIAILITNNKRKSLLKSKIILNLDYSQEMLNEFSINRDGILINILTKAEISTKGFNGINILDYEILYDGYEENKLVFQNQKVYESKIMQKNENEIEQLLMKDNVRIVNLTGKNGIIHSDEYVRMGK